MSVEADQHDDDGAPEPDGDRESADMAKLRNAAARLMEHFDTVQIFVTRHVDADTGTVAATYGDGNWYARRGQIGDWVTKQDGNALEE